MASGTGLATALAALKGHAAAVAVVGTLIVGGGAAAVGVTTGAVHIPGTNSSTQHGNDSGGTSARQAACANNGDAQRLAATFAPMFGGDKAAAQTNICVLFVGTDGHAVGLGEIQQALEITAAIETNGGSTACLSGSSTSDHGSQNGGQPSFTAPTSSTATTMGLVKQVFAAVQHGTALGKLAQDCGATPVTGSPGSGSGDHGQPTGTPGGKPTGTSGARPTGTPGRP